jgi:hypothetical protein
MEQLKLNKTNIIDIATLVVVILFLSMGAIYYFHKPAPINTKLDVTVHVGDSIISKAILVQAEADKTGFLDSINTSLAVKGVKENLDTVGQLNSLDITLEGPGYIDKNNNYIFDGQRILINQKAEIHANYFAQGAITKIANAK